MSCGDPVETTSSSISPFPPEIEPGHVEFDYAGRPYVVRDCSSSDLTWPTTGQLPRQKTGEEKEENKAIVSLFMSGWTIAEIVGAFRMKGIEKIAIHANENFP